MIIVKFIYYLLFFLFIAKIFLDFIKAYVLVWKLFKSNEDKISFSFMPIDFFCLILMCIVSLFISSSEYYFNFNFVIGYGFLAILISYIHFFVVGFIGGWVISMFGHKNSDE